MRLTKVAVPLVLIAAIAAFPPGAWAAPAHTLSHHTVRNPQDGTTIAFTVFKPAGASAARKVPVVLHSHGWGGSRATEIGGAVEQFLDAGMGVVSFDQRGFGESTGQAHVQDPTKETEDVQALIDFVARLPWVRHDVDRQGRAIRNDPVMGAVGGSYGGGYQTMTALDEIAEQGRTRFNALAPEITWFDLPESLAPNKVPRTAWTVVLYAAGARDVPQYIHEAFVWGAATSQWPDGTVLGEPVEGVPNIDAEFHKHSPLAFVERGIRINVPVLQRQGVNDNLFNLNEGLNIFHRALTPAARRQSFFVGYNGGHALPNVAPMGTGGGTIATSVDACSAPDFTAVTIRFFKRVFAGQSTAGVLPAKYNLTTAAEDRCLRLNSVARRMTVPAEMAGTRDVVAVSGPIAGAALHLPIADGPITVAGVPRLSGTMTALGADARAFFGLSVGTTPADAKVIANNLMPIRYVTPVVGEPFSLDLSGVAVEVPAGQSLFLTVSPMSDLFFGHASKAPAGWRLADLKVSLPASRT